MLNVLLPQLESTSQYVVVVDVALERRSREQNEKFCAGVGRFFQRWNGSRSLQGRRARNTPKIVFVCSSVRLYYDNTSYKRAED